MYFNSNLLKELVSQYNKPLIIDQIIEKSDYSAFKTYLKENDINVNELLKRHDISYKKIGYDLMKYHFRKTGKITNNENFNLRFFSIISSEYIKKATNGNCKNKYEIKRINFKTGEVILK